MPFTASHPAAVLPLVGRAGLVPAGLVIGSMAPDLPYFLQFGSDPSLTHSAVGVATIDLVLGLVAFAAWHGLVGPAVVAAGPAGLRARVGAPGPLRAQFASAQATTSVVASLVVGSATHVLWDAFTHAGRLGTQFVPWLSADHAGLAGYRWAQYASGLAGLAVIAWWLARWWRRSPCRPADPVDPPRVPAAAMFWVAIASATLLAGIAGLADALAADQGARRGLFRAATWGGGAGLLTLLAASGAVRARRSPRCGA